MVRNFSGGYRILNHSRLLAKASNRQDPRHIFYAAMLKNCEYAGYLAEVGSITVRVATNNRDINGRMEIGYARDDRKWIIDA